MSSSQELPRCNFLQTHLQEQEFFWFTSYAFLKRPALFKYWLLRPFFYKEATSESSTEKGLLYALEEFCEEHFKCLSLDTPLWYDVMSTSLKNPEEHRKGTLSDQPQLTRVTSTALLSHWGWQSLKDMMSLGTDFEMHAIWQGYVPYFWYWRKPLRKGPYKCTFGAPDQGQTLDVSGGVQQMSTLRWRWHRSHHLSPAWSLVQAKISPEESVQWF